MEKRTVKETYVRPEVEVFLVVAERYLAVSQTEPIEDDPVEHEW